MASNWHAPGQSLDAAAPVSMTSLRTTLINGRQLSPGTFSEDRGTNHLIELS